jgi:hypothetical protein
MVNCWRAAVSPVPHPLRTLPVAGVSGLSLLRRQLLEQQNAGASVSRPLVGFERFEELCHEPLGVVENLGNVGENGVLDQFGQTIRKDRSALRLPAVQ